MQRRVAHRFLTRLRQRLRDEPVMPARTRRAARAQLRRLLPPDSVPALLATLTVDESDGEVVLAAWRGETRRALTEPRVSWTDFVRGQFEPGAVATELVAHLNVLSPRTVAKLSRGTRRKS